MKEPAAPVSLALRMGGSPLLVGVLNVLFLTFPVGFLALPGPILAPYFRAAAF